MAADPSVTEARFGAVPDGATDCHAAFVKAVAFCVNHGLPLHVPAGAYYLSDGLATNGNLTLYGDSRLGTQLLFADGVTGLLIKGQYATVNLETFRIVSPSGTGVQLGTPTISNTQSRIHDVAIDECSTGFNFINTGALHLSDCFVFNASSSAFRIANPLSVDGGDSWIRDCYCQQSGALSGKAYWVYMESGGGWKFLSNKALAYSVGWFANLILGDAASSAYVIDGNSIEGCINGCIGINNQQPMTGTLINLSIINNEMGSNGGIGIDISPHVESHRPYVLCAMVSNNIIRNVSGRGGISIDGSDTIAVTGNVIDDAGTPTGPGIDIGSHVTKGLVSHNLVVRHPLGTTCASPDVVVAA